MLPRMGFYALHDETAPGEVATSPRHPRPEKADPPSKNRVWNFLDSTENRAGSDRHFGQCSRRENPPTLTIIVSGRPFWPNRDPIGENGGTNLYGFAENDLPNNYDLLGLTEMEMLDPGLITEESDSNSQDYCSTTTCKTSGYIKGRKETITGNVGKARVYNVVISAIASVGTNMYGECSCQCGRVTVQTTATFECQEYYKTTRCETSAPNNTTNLLVSEYQHSHKWEGSFKSTDNIENTTTTNSQLYQSNVPYDQLECMQKCKDYCKAGSVPHEPNWNFSQDDMNNACDKFFQ